MRTLRYIQKCDSFVLLLCQYSEPDQLIFGINVASSN